MITQTGICCKRCEAKEYVKNGIVRGVQRHRCGACGCNFTATPKRGKPPQMKALALLRYAMGHARGQAPPCGSIRGPPFSALFTLWLPTRQAVGPSTSAGGFSINLPAALDVQGVMHAIQRSVISPVAEITTHRASGRQILEKTTPRATRAHHIHDAVRHLPHIDFTLAVSMPAQRNH
jgi:hypothetical protein